MLRKRNNNNNKLVMGAAAGGILGAAALLLATKPGKELRSDLLGKYHDAAAQAIEASRRGREVLSKLSRQQPQVVEEGVKRHFLIGSIAGSLIGATAALLLATKSGCELRRDLSETYEDVSEKTAELANTVKEKGLEIADTIQTQSGQWAERIIATADIVTGELKAWRDTLEGEAHEVRREAEKNHVGAGIGNFLEIAAIGLNLWQNIRDRKR